MADELIPGLGDKSLTELGNLSDFHERNADQAVSASRAATGMGGSGNSMDDWAREKRNKQVAVDDEIFGRLSSIHESRSDYAQKQDESRKARVPDSPETWANDPNSYDWPGIDTPR